MIASISLISLDTVGNKDVFPTTSFTGQREDFPCRKVKHAQTQTQDTVRQFKVLGVRKELRKYIKETQGNMKRQCKKIEMDANMPHDNKTNPTEE